MGEDPGWVADSTNESLPGPPVIVVGTTVETIRKTSSKALPATVSDARPVAVAVLSRLMAALFGSALAFRVALVLLANVVDSNAPCPGPRS
ncbi:MAG TPA: hypothetical protein VH231_08585 [Solirubrobacteraceae bacterium]|nr:hypothetical protein [Solirubrobacteraceae bacterium]